MLRLLEFCLLVRDQGRVELGVVDLDMFVFLPFLVNCGDSLLLGVGGVGG